MQINYLDINIIDTVENETVLSFEKTPLQNPTLIYNGAEDKFQNIMTSELTFSFLVKENVDGKFFNLFSGSESRFKVELIDSSVAGFPKIVWVGFLLPEQFEEPYIHSNFYVNFVATDAIALLKTKDFSLFGETTKQSVLQVINRCLISTGLQLPVYFTEAIQNVAFNLDYLDLCVNTDAYVNDKGKKDDCFTVLENCLTSIGARLFLFNGIWYIIGLNKFKETSMVFSKYVVNEFLQLEFDEKITYTREIISTKFNANPTVTILPPLKTVQVNWAHEDAENLIPEDVVTHMPVNIDADVDDRTLKYWSLESDTSFVFQVWLSLGTDFDFTTLNFETYYNGLIATPNANKANIWDGPKLMINTVATTIDLADLANNFGYLTDSFFVYGSEDLERFATLEISFEAYRVGAVNDDITNYLQLEGTISAIANNGAGLSRVTSTAHGLETGETITIVSTVDYSGTYQITKIDANTFDINKTFTATALGNWKIVPFKNIFHWAIVRKDHENQLLADEEIYLSNFATTGIPDGIYDFDVTASTNGVKGTLKIDKIALTDDGYYNIRIYPIVDHPLLFGLIIYDKLTFTLKQAESIETKKVRNIAYSQKHELDVFHSSSRNGLSIKSFSFSDALSAAITAGDIIPGELILTPVSYTATDVLSGGVLWYTLIEVVIDDADYVRLDNGYTLFVLKSGETVLEEVVDYVLNDGAQKKITQFKLAGASGVFIEETDVIYMKLASVSDDLNYPGYWLDKFKRYDIEESVQFYEAIAKMYHDLLFEYNFKINGEISELVGPLDIVQFPFRGVKNYYPTTMTLNLTEGKTTLTIVEQKNQNVTDYVE